jgi:hypothetical protein
MFPFVFHSGGTEALSQETLVVRIGSNVGTREQLFDRFSTELGLPDYFGGNWDAFDECMQDLHWVETKRVVIVHDGIPPPPEDSLRTYLAVLARRLSKSVEPASSFREALQNSTENLACSCREFCTPKAGGFLSSSALASRM